MSKPKKEKIVFQYAEVIDKGDWKDTKVKKKNYRLIYTKLYNEGMFKVTQVSTCASLLLFFLADNMKEDGVIFSNHIIRGDFHKYCISNKIKYTDATVKVAFSELKEADLLIEMTRGVMWINPIYIWRGDEPSRVNAMQTIFNKRYTNLKVTLE